MHSEWACTAGRYIETQDGRSVRVIYPGMSSGGAGPDYKDAVLSFEGDGVVRGDVELHVHYEDWRRHGHNTDHAYDRVVLHVVGTAARAAQTFMASGRETPIAVLKPRAGFGAWPALPCRRTRDARRKLCGASSNGREWRGC